ncbi:MAG: helix-hairpin-helix domain-containing protein [Bacteroidales bacterium]|jgi:DNA uptake protein ComE-like DNA-binding protein|nr:helix-hairpin-helix domain-containing protein [Bacteroidales bacterium]
MKNLFNFSRSETVSAAILLAVIVISFLFSHLYHQQTTGNWDTHDFREKVRLFDEKQQAWNDSIETERQNRKTQGGARYDFRDYEFDNSDYRFYKQRYGWDSAAYPSFDSASFRARTAKQQYTVMQLNLNRCDTGDIIVIPQFGAKRAQKLVEYRQKLGGFHSFEQLAEVYILQNIKTEHLAKYFFIDTTDIKKLEINNATYKELIAHPYFDAYLTKTILNYRNKNGKISNIAQFKDITKAYPELLEKMEPYLSFE